MVSIDGKPGLAVTSHDVARRAGVSQSTVSRAFRNDRVSLATRERVLAAADELGYVPSEIGRSLVTQNTRTVGIVVTDLTSVFYPHIVAPLHDELAALGYRMVIFTEAVESDAPAREDTLKPLLDRLLDRSIDGVVLTTSRLDGIVPRTLAERGLPFVFLTRHVDSVIADSAVVDNSLGASLATGEAIRLGHTRIGAIFGPPDTSTGRDRERGVRAALEAAGIELPPERTFHGPFSVEAGEIGMAHLLELDPAPTVVLCSNDTVAIGAYNAALAAGRSIPDDISLVGFDNLPIAHWEVFKLTTVHQPMEEMARAAAGLLVERIEGRRKQSDVRQVVFEPRLVLRRTLGTPPSS
jgi:LacI family transcriptional regulator